MFSPDSQYTPPGGKNQGAARSGAQYGRFSALRRPERLAAWSRDLTGLLRSEGVSLWDGWEFTGARMTRAEFEACLVKIRSCGSLLELRASVDRETGEVAPPVVHAGNYCHQHAICPQCAGRVQDRRLALYSEPIRAAAAQYRRAYLVTATLRPGDSWDGHFSELRAAWRRFCRMGQKRGSDKRSRGEWGKVGAALAKIELKRGAGSGKPHCHIHALAFSDEDIDYRQYSGRGKLRAPKVPVYDSRSGLVTYVQMSPIMRQWYKATEGAGYNIRVDPIRMRKADRRAGRSWPEAVACQAVEVLKYATKFDSHPEKGQEKLFAEDFVGIRMATYGRRLFTRYGQFRDISADEFSGGGAHISTRPELYAAAWDRHQRRYNVAEIDRPIFPGADVGEAAKPRLVTLARFLGRARRIRTAIFRARDEYFRTGQLAPASYLVPVYPEDVDGKVTCKRQIKYQQKWLEVPESIAARPGDSARWEAWADEWRDKSRIGYSSLRDALRAEWEEIPAYVDEVHKAGILRQLETIYWDDLVAEFQRTLEATGTEAERLHPMNWYGEAAPHPAFCPEVWEPEPPDESLRAASL